MKILLADDDPDFVLLLKTFLEARGWRVIIANDALQASMVARRDAPDAILLDINMPGGSGIRALKQLKSSPRFGRIPIIVVSARDDEQLPRSVTELGAAAFLRKPVAPQDIHEILVRFLGEPAIGTTPASPARSPADGSRSEAP